MRCRETKSEFRINYKNVCRLSLQPHTYGNYDWSVIPITDKILVHGAFQYYILNRNVAIKTKNSIIVINRIHFDSLSQVNYAIFKIPHIALQES